MIPEDTIQILHSFDIDVVNREIFLAPDSGELDVISCTRFIKNMLILNREDNNPIVVHIVSDGGDMAYGMSIYDVIKQSKSPVISISYSGFSSMSSIIPQAADIRLLLPDTDCLIHYGECNISNNYMAAMSTAKWYARVKKSMIDIYMQRIVDGPYFIENCLSKAQIEKWLITKIKNAQDFYMTVEEAIDFGFADGILGEGNFKDIGKIKNELCKQRTV